jgi:hypothetical protein
MEKIRGVIETIFESIAGHNNRPRGDAGVTGSLNRWRRLDQIPNVDDSKEFEMNSNARPMHQPKRIRIEQIQEAQNMKHPQTPDDEQPRKPNLRLAPQATHH